MLLNSKNKFLLHNILHCPHASFNLLSIQKFCSDNSCYFVLTASHFFVKDLQTRKILLQGQSEGGLYPMYLKQMKLNSSNSKTAHISSFTALQGVRAPIHIWHSRLAHASESIVSRVVREAVLPNSGPVSRVKLLRVTNSLFLSPITNPRILLS
ncbi:hypothetical protein Pint_33476 [Pistacia integerrima]|uniref:Uncharacterized protein n=1 Tax=Pistacia integerrima TaxID=434235 RepID=A0ACC0X2G8_9ROSI|nr:hypothetical protein Pint_33476 [Pistacia integerrima]